MSNAHHFKIYLINLFLQKVKLYILEFRDNLFQNLMIFHISFLANSTVSYIPYEVRGHRVIYNDITPQPILLYNTYLFKL